MIMLISEFAKVCSIFRETIAVVLFHVQQPRHYIIRDTSKHESGIALFRIGCH